MSTPVVYNGVTYNVPSFDDTGYAQGAGNMSAYWIALATGSLQATGGAFTLTNDVNFGPNFGLLSKYFTSVTTNAATAGSVRLAVSDTIDWRNNANSANLALGVNGSDQLTFNGSPLTGGFVTTLTGTANEIIVSSPTGAVTLSTPQPIASTSTPTFNSLTLTNPLTVANGGTGTTTPSLIGGTNITITGSWPDQTVSASGSIAVPSGAITMYGGSAAPSGWLLCDGTSYTTAGQPTLFAAIGYAYGGAGANFNVPNFVNNTGVGIGGSIVPALGNTAGSSTHIISSSELPTHNHTITDPGHAHNLLSVNLNTADNSVTLVSTNALGVDAGSSHVGSSTTYSGSNSVGTAWIQSQTTGITINNAGSSSAMSLVQPSLGVNYIIKT